MLIAPSSESYSSIQGLDFRKATDIDGITAALKAATPSTSATTYLLHHTTAMAATPSIHRHCFDGLFTRQISILLRSSSFFFFLSTPPAHPTSPLLDPNTSASFWLLSQHRLQFDLELQYHLDNSRLPP